MEPADNDNWRPASTCSNDYQIVRYIGPFIMAMGVSITIAGSVLISQTDIYKLHEYPHTYAHLNNLNRAPLALVSGSASLVMGTLIVLCGLFITILVSLYQPAHVLANPS